MHQFDVMAYDAQLLQTLSTVTRRQLQWKHRLIATQQEYLQLLLLPQHLHLRRMFSRRSCVI